MTLLKVTEIYRDKRDKIAYIFLLDIKKKAGNYWIRVLMLKLLRLDVWQHE
jgi:hypothetical protein